MEIIFDGPRRGDCLRNSTGMPRVFYPFPDPPGQSDRPACNAVIVQVVSDRWGNGTRLIGSASYEEFFKQNQTGSDVYNYGLLFLLAVGINVSVILERDFLGNAFALDILGTHANSV